MALRAYHSFDTSKNKQNNDKKIKINVSLTFFDSMLRNSELDSMLSSLSPHAYIASRMPIELKSPSANDYRLNDFIIIYLCFFGE